MISHFLYNASVPAEDREDIYNQYVALPEHVVIKTCRRVEVFKGSGVIAPEAVLHLFRLVSGLESPIFGDTSVQNQVKLAYENAARNNNLNKFLHKLFQEALRTGKKVRTYTTVSKGAVSYSQAIVQLLRLEGKLSSDTQIAIVGVSKLVSDLIKYFKHAGAKNITVLNRTFERAQELAERHHIKCAKLESCKETLRGSNILITAASAIEPFITKDLLDDNNLLTIIDIGVPANVAPDARIMRNIEYCSIDDVEKSVEENLSLRREEESKAMIIINKAVADYLAWQQSNISSEILAA